MFATLAWKSGLARLVVAPGVGAIASCTSGKPCELGIRTPTLHCTLWSWGYRPLVFLLAHGVGYTDFHVYRAPQVGHLDWRLLVYHLEFGIPSPTLWCGTSSWGCVLPIFDVAIGVEDTNPRASVLLLQSVIRNSTLLCWPSSWEYGPPRLLFARAFRDTNSHAWVWPLELLMWTPTLQCGPSSWQYGCPCFGVAPRVWDTDFQASVWQWG